MNELLQSAMHLKQAEVDRERPKFLAAPMHLQATLFHDAATTCWRGRPLDARMAEAQRRILSAKEAMGAALRPSAEQSPPTDDAHTRLRKAQRCYEEAYGLFVYIEGCGGDIRKRGIKDEDLTFVDDVTPNLGEGDVGAAGRAQARHVVVGLLCNYAIVCKQMSAVGGGGALGEAAVAALREANHRDPLHLRAAYLLAKQLHVHAGYSELEESISILSHALADAGGGRHAATTAPSSEHVRDAQTLLGALRAERDRVLMQKRKTAKQFLASSATTDDTHTAADGQVGRRCDAAVAATTARDETAASPLSSGPLPGDWYAQAELCRCTVERMRREGQQGEAQRLDEQLREACAEKLFVECLRPKRIMDVGRLPEEAKAFCQKLGIDPATDALVQAYLQRRTLSHCTEDLPSHHMTVLEVELTLYAMGLVKTTELNDTDARNRHNELFVTKALAPGPVPTAPILAGLDASFVERYGRELRAKLKRAWGAKSK